MLGYHESVNVTCGIYDYEQNLIQDRRPFNNIINQ
jgi:hypothetical protein